MLSNIFILQPITLPPADVIHAVTLNASARMLTEELGLNLFFLWDFPEMQQQSMQDYFLQENALLSFGSLLFFTNSHLNVLGFIMNMCINVSVHTPTCFKLIILIICVIINIFYWICTVTGECIQPDKVTVYGGVSLNVSTKLSN